MIPIRPDGISAVQDGQLLVVALLFNIFMNSHSSYNYTSPMRIKSLHKVVHELDGKRIKYVSTTHSATAAGRTH